MNKFALPIVVVAVLATAALAQPPRPLDHRTISLGGGNGGTLAVINGQPRLVHSPSAWTEWTLRETDKGWTIQGRLSGEAARASFLSVDTEGKVTLAPKSGAGVCWKINRKGDRLTSFEATIQAVGGKCDGWYLDFSDEQEQVEKGKLQYKSYRPMLSKEAGPRTKLHIFLDGL
jgi:hypothetical protein